MSRELYAQWLPRLAISLLVLCLALSSMSRTNDRKTRTLARVQLACKLLLANLRVAEVILGRRRIYKSKVIVKEELNKVRSIWVLT